MKKYARFITGALDLLIVVSAVFIPTWKYYSFNYFYGSSRYGMTTINLFSESMYNDEILHISLIISFVMLVVSGILSLTNKNLNIVKISQSIASVVIAVMYFLVHIEFFSFIADFTSCTLNVMGYLVIVLCVINTIISVMYIKEENNQKFNVKEDENVL